MATVIKGIVATCLFLAYPFLVYRGIESGMAWVVPAFLSAIYLFRAFAARTVNARIYKAVISVTLLLGAFYLQSVTAKLMPVLIQLMLVYYFGRTLQKGKEPSLIERFVRLEYPEFPPSVSEYCRHLTILWTVFFAFNGLMCLALALWGNDFWWTLYNGVLIYVMVALLMIGEYIYRHFRFPWMGITDPLSTIKTMIVNGRKMWRNQQA